jgi:hypothetical protein
MGSHDQLYDQLYDQFSLLISRGTRVSLDLISLAS